MNPNNRTYNAYLTRTEGKKTLRARILHAVEHNRHLVGGTMTMRDIQKVLRKGCPDYNMRRILKELVLAGELIVVAVGDSREYHYAVPTVAEAIVVDAARAASEQSREEELAIERMLGEGGHDCVMAA